MRKYTLFISFEPTGEPPTGDPPGFRVTSGPGKVTMLDGDDGLDVLGQASYETHVEMTGEDTFLETGTMSLGRGGLQISTIGHGVLEPSAEEGTLQGAVLWRVRGTGRLSGMTGLLSSSFAIDAQRGTGVEHQVLRLFSP